VFCETKSVGVRRCSWSVNKAPNGEAEPYFDRSRQVWVAPWRKPEWCSAPWPRGSAPRRRLASCRPGGSIMGHSMTPIDDTDPLDSTTSSFVAVFAAVWARGDGPDEFCGSLLADWVDPDVTFTQPLAPAAHGHEGFRRFTAFAVVPDLRCI